jgi:hypothetical protein
MDILSCQAFIRFTGATQIEGFFSRNRNRYGRAGIRHGCHSIDRQIVVMTAHRNPT